MPRLFAVSAVSIVGLLISSVLIQTSATKSALHNTYILPYPTASSCKLLQGYNGPYGHTGAVEFAYDFQMPIGSPVNAARDGEVVSVVEKNNDGTRAPGEENVVVIKHSDGTFGRYYHLRNKELSFRLAIRLSRVTGSHSAETAAQARVLIFTSM